MTGLEDWQILLGLFPSEWRQLGRSSGAVRRLRGFPSLDALLRTLLLHMGCGWSLRERLGKALQQWKGLASLIECGQSFGSRTVRLLVREPGKTGSQWRDSLQPAAAHAGVPPRCLL